MKTNHPASAEPENKPIAPSGSHFLKPGEEVQAGDQIREQLAATITIYSRPRYTLKFK